MELINQLTVQLILPVGILHINTSKNILLASLMIGATDCRNPAAAITGFFIPSPEGKKGQYVNGCEQLISVVPYLAIDVQSRMRWKTLPVKTLSPYWFYRLSSWLKTRTFNFNLFLFFFFFLLFFWLTLDSGTFQSTLVVILMLGTHFPHWKEKNKEP